MTNVAVSTGASIVDVDKFISSLYQTIRGRGSNVTGEIIRVDDSPHLPISKQVLLLYSGDPHPDSYCALAIPYYDEDSNKDAHQVVVFRNYQLAHIAKKFLEALD